MQTIFFIFEWKTTHTIRYTNTQQLISHFTSHDLHAQCLNEENDNEHDTRDRHNTSNWMRKHQLVATHRWWPTKEALTTQNNWWIDPPTFSSDATNNHVLVMSGETNHVLMINKKLKSPLHWIKLFNLLEIAILQSLFLRGVDEYKWTSVF